MILEPDFFLYVPERLKMKNFQHKISHTKLSIIIWKIILITSVNTCVQFNYQLNSQSIEITGHSI